MITPRHQFINPETVEFYGSFVVEYIAVDPLLSDGWYWTALHGEPVGPFETYDAAVSNARGED